MSIQRLFCTQVFQGPLGLNAKSRNLILKTALKVPEIDIAGVSWSKKNYLNGYTSYGSLNRLHEQFNVLDELKQKLDRKVSQYLKVLKLNPDQGRIQLSTLWLNIMPSGCYHAFHFHPLSVISGTYYLEVEKNSSPLRLEDPRANLFMASPARPIQHDLMPKNDDVILFESWMKHEVPPHSSKKNRISLSFNYDWIDR
jgi:uncharacterized protein (TIGR02466 family)